LLESGGSTRGQSAMIFLLEKAIQLPKHPLLMVDDPIVGDIEDV
jgi:hypothetical protein